MGVRIQWRGSPDESRSVNRIELWLAEVAAAQAEAVTSATVNGFGGCSWLQDGSARLCHIIVAARPRAHRWQANRPATLVWAEARRPAMCGILF